jgi:hypothetical protein
MPRPCSICTHPQRQAIDQALTAGEALRNMAPRFGTSVTALHRHKHEHLLAHRAGIQQPQHLASDMSQPPAEPTQPALPPEAARVLEQYRALAVECERVRTQDWRRSPYSPNVVYDPLVRQLAALRQQCLALGVHPERDGP